MNENLLSRGKRKDNGEWVTGYYVPVGDKYHYICTGKLTITNNVPTFEHFYVIPETVGRCTGLTDKNDILIFEGDIVRVPMHKAGETPNYMTGFVEWINGAFSVTWDDTQFGRHFVGYLENIEIIGNIYAPPSCAHKEDNGKFILQPRSSAISTTTPN